MSEIGKRSPGWFAIGLMTLVAMTGKPGFAQMVPAGASTAAKTPPNAELAETEKHLRTYLKTNDGNAEAHYQLAYTLFRENNPTDSLAEYTRAAALSKPTTKDLQAVALDYVLLDDYKDADHWMSMVVQQDPRNMEAWYEYGRIKYTENRFSESIESFQKALALAPRSVKAENNLGLALEGLNRTDEAIAAYRQAIAWQKDVPNPSEQPLLNLAIVFTNHDNLQEALELAKAADGIAPRDPKISEQLGRIYLKLGDLPNAQAALEKAAGLAPDVAAIHFELAQIYRKQGKSDRAKEEFARVAALNGTHSSKQP